MGIKKDGDLYKVESSKKGKYYTVDVLEPSCTCPHFQFRLRNTNEKCKHIKEVEEYIKNKKPLKKKKKNIKAFSKPKKKEGQSIVGWIKDNQPVDAIEAIEMYGQDVIDDMVAKGEIIEKNGLLRVMT